MTEPARKRVIGIVGSPRRNGNTELLVDEALRGAEEAGAEVRKVILDLVEIAPCRGCDRCQVTGNCVQSDELPALMAEMQQYDIWVLGMPIYWWGPSAQFKAFLDRWYAYPDTVFEGRRIILTIPFGDTDPQTARHTVGMLRDSFDYVKAELFEVVLAPGQNKAGDVRRHPDLLALARDAGRNAVAGARIPAGEMARTPLQADRAGE
jgi:NAD(P)H-dependent FMN reductase